MSTKSLQERTIEWKDGVKIGNKYKLILIEANKVDIHFIFIFIICNNLERDSEHEFHDWVNHY